MHLPAGDLLLLCYYKALWETVEGNAHKSPDPLGRGTDKNPLLFTDRIYLRVLFFAYFGK